MNNDRGSMDELQEIKYSRKKVKVFYRVLCFFISFLSLIALFGAIFFGIKDSLIGGLVASLVPLGLIYVCVPILLVGYPPRPLLWIIK